MKKIVKFLLIILMVFSVVACGSKTDDGSSTDDGSDTSDLPLAGKKIAYVYNGTPTDIFVMADDAARNVIESLGGTYTYQSTDADDAKFQDYAYNFANQGYDGILLSHGSKEYMADLVKDLNDNYGMAVVTFDSQFVDANGNTITVDGVTQMFQDDAGMAEMLLNYALDELYPEKETINVLKLWKGPGISPFDRRQTAYVKFEENGSVNTLEVVTASSEAEYYTAIDSIIKNYDVGDVDVIWSCYDAYGRGAYQALLDNNRTGDVKLVSVDISNQDINYMLDGNNSWMACACVDFTLIGDQGMRLVAMKLHGDEVESLYELTPSLIRATDLKEGANVNNLSEYISSYGDCDDHNPDWIAEYVH